MFKASSHVLIEGVVERGDQRGRELGFPTANIEVGHDVLRRDGVWAGLVHLDDGLVTSPLVAAVSVGRRPTFYDKLGLRLLEAHLLGFSDDLYGQRIRVELCRRLRPMRAFEDADSLVRQLHLDVAGTRTWATEHGLEVPDLRAQRPLEITPPVFSNQADRLVPSLRAIRDDVHPLK